MKAHATTRSHTCYLVRHAIAESRGPEWPDDGLRPLTPRGIARMRQVVQGLRAYGVEFDRVISSPLVRARQTADILAAGFDMRQGDRARSLLLLPVLAPGTGPGATMRALATAVPTGGRLALVGHEPDLGLLAAWLLGTRHAPAFKKGGVCRIDLKRWPARAGSGDLVWWAPPRLLRLAGR